MPGDAKGELRSVYVPLRLTYGLVPMTAGLDKFTNLLTDWTAYLPPFVTETLPVAPATFMQLVGLIEIAAGLAVLAGLTRLGGTVVATWLTLIAVVAAAAGYYDVAARDVTMAVGAYALARLAALRGEEWISVFTRAGGHRAHAGAY